MSHYKLIKTQKGINGDNINIYENTEGESFAMYERSGIIILSPEQLLYKIDVIERVKREIFELNIKNDYVL